MAVSHDSKLVGFVAATDDALMRTVLSRVVDGAHTNGDGPIVAVHHSVIKHTLGKRCVIAYGLERERVALRLIGKLHRGARGIAAFQRFHGLWRLTREHGGDFGMAEPLAYIESLGMALQTFIPGTALSRVPAEERGAALERAADNLVELHRLPPRVGEWRSVAGVLAKQCRPGPEPMAAGLPELSPRVLAVLKILAVGPSLEHEARVVHGDLGLSQIFDDGARARFVDFDSLCLAPRELDVAGMVVSLRLHGAETAEITRFLDRYRARSGADLACLPLYLTLGYFRRAMIAFRRRSGDDWTAQVARLLDLALEDHRGDR